MIDDDNQSPWEGLDIDQGILPQAVRAKPRPLNAGEISEVTYEEVLQEALPEEEQQEDAVQNEESVQGMSEVEKRLEKAILYQQWINGKLYDSPTESTLEVEQEFKEFALKQLNKLIGLGVQEPKVSNQFSDEEVLILRALAQNIVSNHKIKKEVENNTLVQSKVKKTKVEAPAKPAIKQEKPVQKAPAPKLQVKSVPETVKKPVPGNVEKLNSIKPPMPAPKSLVQATPKVNQVKPSNKPFFGKDGEIIEENGKKFEVKWIPINSMTYGRGEQNRLENMAPKSILALKGLTIYKTEGEELFSIIKRDMTPKEIPANAVPFPSIAMMPMATLEKASASHETGRSAFLGKMGVR